jgi:hypothetical protein
VPVSIDRDPSCRARAFAQTEAECTSWFPDVRCNVYFEEPLGGNSLSNFTIALSTILDLDDGGRIMQDALKFSVAHFSAFRGNWARARFLSPTEHSFPNNPNLIANLPELTVMTGLKRPNVRDLPTI